MWQILYLLENGASRNFFYRHPCCRFLNLLIPLVEVLLSEGELPRVKGL